MKKYLKGFVWATLIALTTVRFSACTADDEAAPTDGNTRAAQATMTVSGVINSNTTWTGNNAYQPDGKVYASKCFINLINLKV
ncbi:MAG: hypothetical protein LBG15_03310 [Dysgonamonadaceae bacterium]|jgi:uncharacterized protein (DUF2147 family)|nr:hypothetical protein [Dysgonamonadaceae bacterium]